MNFRSVAQLSDQLLMWSKVLPRDIDVIVGLPRSGLLVASLLATYRNLPLTDPRGLIEGRCISWGEITGKSLTSRYQGDADRVLAQPAKVLVVDDSVLSAGTLRKARAVIEAAHLPHDIRYAAVYAADETAAEQVDFVCEILAQPRVFEWNLFRHRILGKACVDMDGVLCVDPRNGEDDDGPAYERFLGDARPLFQPSVKVGWVVTSRLERHRAATEEWLATHDVEYGELVMLDYPDAATRRRMHTRSAFKADVYRATGALLFVESSIRQAVEIAEYSRKDVVCTDTMQLVRPGHRPLNRAVSPPSQRKSLPKRMAQRVLPADLHRALRSRRG